MTSYHTILASAFLLLAATIIGISGIAPVSLIWYALVSGILLAAYSSFMRMYKSYLSVRISAIESVRAVQTIIPNVSIGTNEGMMELEMTPVRHMMSHMFGTGFLLLSKILNYLTLGTAALVSVFYLMFAHFGHPDPLPFIGAWLIMLALIIIIIRSLPFSRGIDRVYPLVGLEVGSWLTDSVSIWAILVSLGYFINPIWIFLPMSLVLLSSKLPVSLYGLGIVELAGFVIAVFSVPLFPVFLAFLIWDITRIVSYYLMAISWRNLEMRRRMMEMSS